MANITQEDAMKVARMAEVFANKAVFAALIELVSEFAKQKHKNRLINQLKEYIVHPIPGTIELTIADHECKINLCLCLVNRDYVAEAFVPDEQYARDLFSKYEILRRLATTYYATLLTMPQVQELIADIKKALPANCLGELVVDQQNPTTMYFNPASAKRIGIFCFYTDAQGNALHKK